MDRTTALEQRQDRKRAGAFAPAPSERLFQLQHRLDLLQNCCAQLLGLLVRICQGGTLYATYMLGTVDENDLCHLGGIPGGALKELFGIVAEEIDTLYPEERQHALAAGHSCTLADYCEVVSLRGARAIAEYADGWYKGFPAATEHTYGKGRAIYQACRDDGQLKRLLLEPILEQLQFGPAVRFPEPLPEGVSVHSRTDGENTYQFVLNWSATESRQLRLPTPLLDLCSGVISDKLLLEPYGFAVLRITE